LNCFPGVEQAGAVHVPEVVGAGRHSTDMPCFTWINTVLGNVKTSLSGTYHDFNFRKYAHRYLAESQYWFNRRFDLKAILPRLVHAAAVTGPRAGLSLIAGFIDRECPLGLSRWPMPV
jgi:ISXO2-like transposase domain